MFHALMRAERGALPSMNGGLSTNYSSYSAASRHSSDQSVEDFDIAFISSSSISSSHSSPAASEQRLPRANEHYTPIAFDGELDLSSWLDNLSIAESSWSAELNDELGRSLKTSFYGDGGIGFANGYDVDGDGDSDGDNNNENSALVRIRQPDSPTPSSPARSPGSATLIPHTLPRINGDGGRRRLFAESSAGDVAGLMNRGG
jgi:hypothetical protein